VTIVPFHFDDRGTISVANGSTSPNANGDGKAVGNGKTRAATKTLADTVTIVRPAGTTPIGSVRCRQSVRVHGRVQAIRVQPLGGSPSLECTVVDETGGVSVVFFGRRQIEGITIGATMTVEGMAIDHHGRLAIVNPVYELR
jgi:RecG-like helicase